MTLSQACVEKQIGVENIPGELKFLNKENSISQTPFGEMNAEQLISYILIHHHF